MGELDLDKIERLLGPELEEERPQEKRPVIREQSLVDEAPLARRDGGKCLTKTRK